MKVKSIKAGTQEIISSDQWGADLSNNKGFNLFYEALEAIHAYRYSYEILQRRKIAKAVEQSLEKYLTFSYNEKEIEFIKEVLAQNQLTLNTINYSYEGAIELFRKLDKTGVELLEIDNEINIELLKRFYRKAALKYHPDRGGSHEIMIRVNKIYTLFHNALLNYLPGDDSNVGKIKELQTEPFSWEDFQFSVFLVSACLNGDFFAVDNAFYYLKKTYSIALENSSKFVGNLVFDLSDSGEVVSSVCAVLGRFNMKSELHEASRITSYLFDRLIEFLSTIDDPFLDQCRGDYPSEKELNNYLGMRIVLNHPEKAINAFRFGKIDKQRFSKAMLKFNIKTSSQDNEIRKINEFIMDKGFVQKLSNADYNTDISSVHLVNPPSLTQCRFDHLDSKQKCEYLLAFSCNGNGNLVKKYYHIRTQEILLGLVQNYRSINLDLLEEEINFFCAHFSDIFEKYSLLSEFFSHIQSLENYERAQKLSLLNMLDDAEQKNKSQSFSFSLDNQTNSQTHIMPITVNNQYIEFAQKSLEDILHYKETGEFFNSFAAQSNRDRINLENLNNSPIGQKREDVWLRPTNTSPEAIIDSCEPYVRELIELSRHFYPKNTGELGIAYEINRLTIAYGKLKNWSKVVYWSNIFFNLPKHILNQSSKTEINAIKRRFERAKKSI